MPPVAEFGASLDAWLVQVLPCAGNSAGKRVYEYAIAGNGCASLRRGFPKKGKSDRFLHTHQSCGEGTSCGLRGMSSPAAGIQSDTLTF